jgi:hypothetical protein
MEMLPPTANLLRSHRVSNMHCFASKHCTIHFSSKNLIKIIICSHQQSTFSTYNLYLADYFISKWLRSISYDSMIVRVLHTRYAKYASIPRLVHYSLNILSLVGMWWYSVTVHSLMMPHTRVSSVAKVHVLIPISSWVMIGHITQGREPCNVRDILLPCVHTFTPVAHDHGRKQ